MPPPVDKRPPFQRLFEIFGVVVGNANGPNAHAEACPFCGKPKFYLNTETGQYKCHAQNRCGNQGNAYTFIRWIHQYYLARTSNEDYQRLKGSRGLPLQTLKRHELAWDPIGGFWLIPYKSEKGEVLTLLRHNPSTNVKLALPGLNLQLYGIENLKPDASKGLLVCEGAGTRSRWTTTSARTRPERGMTLSLCHQPMYSERKGVAEVPDWVLVGTTVPR